VKRLEAMGLGSVVYSPCASVPGEGDFLGVMRANASRLEKIAARMRAEDTATPQQ
jgi:hypothetical protein